MTCYRVLMFDAKQGLMWAPIFVGDSLTGAGERAQATFPARTVVDVLALHRNDHGAGWQYVSTVVA